MEEKEIGRSCVFFPLVGAFIGLILFIIYKAVSCLYLDTLLTSAIVSIALIVLTGGLHLDGLADTFDAFASNKNREKKLEIMRDSRIGTMGVLALISIIVLKILFLSEISTFDKFTALLSMCILSRWGQVLSIRSFNYAREGGKAKVFFDGINNGIYLSALIITLLFLFLLWQLKGIYLFAVLSIFSYFLGRLFSSKFGGLTGDVIGAISEISEVFVLFYIVILQRFI